MKKNQLLAALLCALSPAAHAANDISLDEVVVTATRIEQPLKQTLSSTTVITQEDIKNSQAADVPTILRSVAGVEISQNGGYGKTSNIYLRGNNSTQVLVLLDGVRINSATSGTTAIEHLMLDQIERIEVVRGNVSSLYGSEAIGGVVQIFTKQGHGDPAFNASAGAGSHGTQRAAAGFGGTNESTNYHLQATFFHTDGVSAVNPGIYPKANPDTNGYQNTSVSANLRHSLNTDNSLSFSAYNSMGNNQYDSTGGKTTDINNNTQKISKVSLASDNTISEKWLSHLQYALGIDESQNYLNSQPNNLYKTSNQQLNWQNTVQLFNKNKLLLGAENLTQTVDSTVKYTINQRTINSLYAGYTGNYDSHRLQTNWRQDNNSQYGVANTGLLGYGYTFDDSWRATTSYSTAYKAPTFNNLYYAGATPGIYDGNPLLKPEQSRNAEVGLHYTTKAQDIDLTYFDNRVTDLIVGYPLKNINEARIDGLELSYTGRYGDTVARANVTIQNPRDLSNNQALERRAMTHSSVAATHKLGSLQIGAEWLYSDTRPDNGKTLPAYHVFNLTAAYAFNQQWKASLRADNITDQNDSNAYGFNPLGRTLFASLNYQQ